MKPIDADVLTINELLSPRKSRYLIPDYQRAYGWPKKYCVDLWTDFVKFALNDPRFNEDESSYQVGVIHTFFNEKNQDEIIDGQQRITTLLLLLRAFYESFNIDTYIPVKNDIGKCIWAADEVGNINLYTKLTSEVIEEEEKKEFEFIMQFGKTEKNFNSYYAVNYRFFLQEVEKLATSTRELLAARILNNVFVVKIRAASQEISLQLFTNCNDKFFPLGDTDLFKAILYRDIMSTEGEESKDRFLERWEQLKEISMEAFGNVPLKKENYFSMAFVAYTYKYYDFSSRKQCREYYSPNNYALLKDPNTLNEIFDMLYFLLDLRNQNKLRFTERVLRLAYIFLRIGSAPCIYTLLVYFLRDHDEKNNVDCKLFEEYLEDCLAVLLSLACSGGDRTNFTGRGFAPLANQLDRPPKMLNSYIITKETIKNNLRDFSLMHGKTFAKQVILVWWMFKNENQELIDLDIKLSYEHIFAKNRANFDYLENKKRLECLGNIALVEPAINSRAKDRLFSDKKKIYLGLIDSKGRNPKGTANRELQKLASTKSDFTEADIIERNEQIISEILKILDKHGYLISEESLF